MKLPRLYASVRRDLAKLTEIDEVKQVHDKSLAMEVYAFQAKDRDLAANATVLRKHAKRRLGAIMAERRAAGKLAKPPGVRKDRVINKPDVQTLADQGVDKNLANAARKEAAMPEEAFEASVKKAVEIAIAAVDGTSEVIKAARTERQEEKRQKREQRERAMAGKILALPDKKYGVILADPEWRFEPWSRKTGMDRAADNHYSTSALEVIKSREVASIAANDCVLFLCATRPMLPHALEVMEAWGFDYKTCTVWEKGGLGTGYWFRDVNELLLVGTRGKVPAPAQGDQWKSRVDAPAGEHSAKPESFYVMIEAYFPNLPKIELNARQRRPGWDAWGLEAPAEAAE